MTSYRRVRDMPVCVAADLVGGGGSPSPGFMTMFAVTCRPRVRDQLRPPTRDTSVGTFTFLPANACISGHVTKMAVT